MNRGYTLIELIVAAGILVLCGGLIVGVIAGTMRGSTKSTTTSHLAQNGGFALSSITDYLINADSVVSSCNGLPQSSVTVKRSGIQGPETVTLTCQSNNITAEIEADDTVNTTQLINSQQSGISISDCSFTCLQGDARNVTPGIPVSPNPYSNPTINIQFLLIGAGTTSDTAAESLFKTSVLLRNYTPQFPEN